MKLQSMTSYVKEQRNKYRNDEYSELVYSYANFLSLNLDKWMFIPCDDDGNVLEEPEIYKITANTGKSKEELEFIEAKLRVVFEGFTVLSENQVMNENLCITFCSNNTVILDVKNDLISYSISHIEDIVKYNLTITEQAVKTYGL